MPTAARLALLCAALLTAVLSPASVDTTWADEPEARARAFGVNAPFGARFAVDETRRLLEASEFERAFRVAQTALDERTGELYVAEQTRESERWRPATAALEELLLALPPEGRARYDAYVAAAVTPLRAQVLAGDGRGALIELERRFAASSAGAEAASLLVELATERGALREAARLARRALRALPNDPGLWLRLIDALAALGEREALQALRPPADLVARTATGDVRLAPRLEAALAGLPAPAPVSGRPTWGGRAARDLNFQGPSLPALGLRWTAATDLQLRERDAPRAFNLGESDEQEDLELHLGGYRPLFPALRGRTLFVSDGRSLRALDLLSGQELWRLDPGRAPLALLEPGAQAGGRTALDRPFAPSLWQDLVITSLEVERPYVPDYLMNVLINTYMPRRVLVGVSRERGTLTWWSGQDPLDRLRLGDVTFVAEPVVSEDLVLAVGARYRVQHSVSLFAFEAATGRLRYETPLAYGLQETNLFGNPVKEHSAGAVSAADGLAYCQTGLGCVAAVEIQTGDVRWIASYDIQPLQRAETWYRAPLRIPRMGPVAPLIVGDLAIVAPADGEHISAFDRKRGQLRWRVPTSLLATPFGALGQIVGVARLEGRDVLLAAGGRVLALDLSGGSLRAVQALTPERSRVVGQGAIVGRTLCVPTDEGLQRFDLDARLSQLGSDPWPGPMRPGNLLLEGRILVVTSRERVQVCYAWTDLEQELERRRRLDPKNPELLVEAGDLYSSGRGPGPAREAYLAALALAPAGSATQARARRGVFATWMAEGQALAADDAARAVAAWRHALSAAATPAERVRARLAIDGALPDGSPPRLENLERLYEEADDERAAFEGTEDPLPVRPLVLLRLARLEEEGGRPQRAVAALQRLLHDQGDVLLGAERAREVARRRIDVLIGRHGPAVYAREEAAAQALLARANSGGDAHALESLLGEYPNASVVPQALLALSQAQTSTGLARAAVESARRLVGRYPDTPEALAGLESLAQGYARLGATGAARSAWLALGRRLAQGRQGPTGFRRTAAEARSAARALLPEASVERTAPPDAPPGRWVERLVRPPPDEGVAVPVRVEAEPEAPSPVALMKSADLVEAFDLSEPGRTFQLDELRAQHAAYAVGTLVVSTPGELVGLSPRDGSVRWRRARTEQVLDLVVADGLVVAWLHEPTAGRALRKLEALDPTTGETVWSSALGTEAIHSLSADGDRLVLQRSRHEEGGSRSWLLAFDALSGTLSWERRLASTSDLVQPVGQGLVIEVRIEARGGRVLVAHDLALSEPRFSRPLSGDVPITGVTVAEDRLWALRLDGTLEAFDLTTGAPGPALKLLLPAEARAAPLHGTRLFVASGQVVFLAVPTRGGPPLVGFSLSDGRPTLTVPAPPMRRSDAHVLQPQGSGWLVLVAGQLAGPRSLYVNVLDEHGTVLQSLTPDPGPRGSVVALTLGPAGALLITGTGAWVYANGPSDQAPAAR